MRKIVADAHIDFPRDVAFATYRDRLPELTPYLPNVAKIEVVETEGDVDGVAGRTRKLNLWTAKTEIPKLAKPFIKPEMLTWKDHAVWHPDEWFCEWRVETALAERVRCEGRSTYKDDGGRCRLEIRGELDVDAAGLPGVPRLLAKKAGPIVEKFVVSLLVPNLTSVADGVQEFLRREAKKS